MKTFCAIEMQLWNYITTNLRPINPETFSTCEGKNYETKFHNVIVVMPRKKYEALVLSNILQSFEFEDNVYGLCTSEKKLRLHKWQSLYPHASFYTLTRKQIKEVKKLNKKCDDKPYNKVDKIVKKDKKIVSAAKASKGVPTQKDYNTYLRSLKKKLSEF
jgi:hypothetical protein